MPSGGEGDCGSPSSQPAALVCLGRRDAIQPDVATEGRAGASVEHTVNNKIGSHPGLSVLKWNSIFSLSPPIVPIEKKQNPTPIIAHELQVVSSPNLKDLRCSSVTNGRSTRMQSRTVTPARAGRGPYAKGSLLHGHWNYPAGRHGKANQANKQRCRRGFDNAVETCILVTGLTHSA